MLTDIEKQIIERELEGLYQFKLKLVEKQNKLRLAEVTQADANQKLATQEALEEVEKLIENTNKKIDDLKNQISQGDTNQESEFVSGLSIVTDHDEDVTSRAVELFKQEAKELNYTSTKEDIAKLHNLRKKVNDEIFGDLDNRLKFVTSRKELMYSSALFDTIYTSEKLDPVTVGEIQKIREDNESYKWYDRSVIISALSLSLINFPFDAKKANLLLDFVTDFEPQVWERALTGIVLGIGYQKNRSWMRPTNFINRLKALKENGEVQNGLKAIDFILKNELYKINLFNPNYFQMDLFKNPMNCFLPFYENNEVLKNASDNASADFDVDDFQKYLDDTPLMDIHKYALCIGLNENKLQEKKLEGIQAFKVLNSLAASDALSPFQNLISEYFQFFNYFPEKIIENIFEKQLIIAKTPLKRYILNKEMKLFVEANTLYSEEKYSEAITKYKQLLQINQSHKDASLSLANCYHLKGEYRRALGIYLKFEKEGIAIERLEYRIGNCYRGLKQYDRSNAYCEKNIKNTSNPSFEVLDLVTLNYIDLEDIKKAEAYCIKAYKNAVDEDDYSKIARRFNALKKHEKALNVIKKVLETNTNTAEYWRVLGNVYMYLYEWDLSIEALKKASALDKKDVDIQLNCGRFYLFSKTDIEKSRKIFEAVSKRKSQQIVLSYGNLGHQYIIEKNNEKALKNYLKCINMLDDEKDFKQRMNSDLPLMLRAGVSEKDYNSMRDVTIEKYLSTKKK